MFEIILNKTLKKDLKTLYKIVQGIDRRDDIERMNYIKREWEGRKRFR